jgi:hypothetical protein
VASHRVGLAATAAHSAVHSPLVRGNTCSLRGGNPGSNLGGGAWICRHFLLGGRVSRTLRRLERRGSRPGDQLGSLAHTTSTDGATSGQAAIPGRATRPWRRDR